MKRDLVILTLIFVLSRVILKLVDLSYDTTSLIWAWQLLDPLWLYNLNSWTIFKYLHMQPPLFNLFTSLSLKLFSDPTIFWELSFMLMGLLTTILLYLIGLHLSLNRKILLILIIFGFILNPSSFLYENWYFYTYPSMFFFTLFAYLCIKRKLVLSLFVLTALIWLISIFQPIIFIILLIVVIIKRGMRYSIIAFSLPFLLSIVPHLKNFMIFGTFSSSSWYGMNVAKGIFWSEKVIPLKYKPSKMFLEKPFSKVDVYEKYIKWKPYGVVITDEKMEPYTSRVNYNHSIYVEVSKRFFKESLRIFFNEPYRIFIILGMSFYMFLKAPYVYLMRTPFMREIHKKRISRILGIYSIIYGNKGPYLIITFIVVLGLLSSLLSFQRLDYTHRLVILTVLYYVLVSSIDPGENNRFRFTIEPFMLIYGFYSLKIFVSCCAKFLKF